MPEDVLDDITNLEIEGEEVVAPAEGTAEEASLAAEDPAITALREFVETSGGEETLKQAKGLYDVYAGTAEAFSPKAFWNELADISETRYRAVAMELFNSNKDYFVNKVLGIDPTAYGQYKEWIAAGRPSASAQKDGITDEELAASSDPHDKELLNLRIWRREQEARQVESQRERDSYLAEEKTAKAKEAVRKFSDDREAQVAKAIEPLKLGDDPIAQKAKKAMKAVALYNFYDDEKSAKLYSSARDYVRDGEDRLAAGYISQIDLRLNRQAAESVAFLSELLSAKRELDALKQKGVASRREPASVGAGVSAATSGSKQSGTGSEPFQIDEWKKQKLAQLRAEGKLGG